jgi:hypothetical protein
MSSYKKPLSLEIPTEQGTIYCTSIPLRHSTYKSYGIVQCYFAPPHLKRNILLTSTNLKKNKYTSTFTQ